MPAPDASPTPIHHDEPALRRRRIRPDLPSARAVVGGLLVTLAGLGVIAGHRAATVPDRPDWLVIRRDVAAGTTIGADDLALAPMDLAADTAPRALRDPDAAIGRVALVPLHRGDLVQRAVLARPADAPGSTRRVGVDLSPADALAGTLEVGDRVDVVARPAPGGDATIVVDGALVSAIAEPGDGVGSSGGVAVVLDVADTEAARRITTAQANGGVALVGTGTVTLDGNAP